MLANIIGIIETINITEMKRNVT